MKLKLLFLSAAMTLASGNASAVFFHIGNGSIDGSLCVGFDCVENESFGLDTIRLKENNLRIHFEDTSTTTGFPTTDWRILINDTASGGGSFFGIQDSDAGTRPMTIEANARTHALFVDSQGDVGIGTSTPAVELHAVRGDTPTLRLEQDGSSGFSPQSWDVAGNEAGFFIRDATNGSTLPFRIRPGAPVMYLEELYHIFHDTPAEYTRAWFNGEQFHITTLIRREDEKRDSPGFYR